MKCDNVTRKRDASKAIFPNELQRHVKMRDAET